MSTKPKVALVTGGTRGIGLAITQALRKAGYKVAVVGKNTKPYQAVVDLFIQRDLSYPESCYGIIQTVLDKFGRIDLLVNNAGGQKSVPVLNWTNEDFEKSLSLMLTTPFVLSKIFALRAFGGNGHIINILSTAAFQGARNIVGYVAAKHGLLGLTRAMAVELAPKIAVNAVAPGMTNTDMIADMPPERRALLESITPSGRFCTPDEIADAVMFLVNSTGIYGSVLTCDGGWLAKNG